MLTILLAALLAGSSTTTAAQQQPAPDDSVSNVAQPAKPNSSEPEVATSDRTEGKADDFDIAKVMAMFDKIFPQQPDPPPERLALARTTAMGVLPNGTYAAMFDDMMSGVADRVLSMSAADFDEKKSGEAAARITLREELAKDDPHFDERMRITRRVISEELLKMAALVEPKLRDGLARSIARRFDERQLHDINAFLATDSGRAFGSQSMRLWVDPDVMRSMFQSVPELFAALPGALKRLDAETAHLPKPPKKKSDEEVEEQEEGVSGPEPDAEQPDEE